MKRPVNLALFAVIAAFPLLAQADCQWVNGGMVCNNPPTFDQFPRGGVSRSNIGAFQPTGGPRPCRYGQTQDILLCDDGEYRRDPRSGVFERVASGGGAIVCTPAPATQAARVHGANVNGRPMVQKAPAPPAAAFAPSSVEPPVENPIRSAGGKNTTSIPSVGDIPAVRWAWSDKPSTNGICSGTAIDTASIGASLPRGYCSVMATALHCVEDAFKKALVDLVERSGEVDHCRNASALGFTADITTSASQGESVKAQYIVPKRSLREKKGDFALMLIPCGTSTASALESKKVKVARQFTSQDSGNVFALVSSPRQPQPIRPASRATTDGATLQFAGFNGTAGDSGGPVFNQRNEFAGVLTGVAYMPWGEEVVISGGDVHSAGTELRPQDEIRKLLANLQCGPL